MKAVVGFVFVGTLAREPARDGRSEFPLSNLFSKLPSELLRTRISQVLSVIVTRAYPGVNANERAP